MVLPSSGMREDAILDPAEAPTTTPTSEKTPARKPVLAPRSITTTTKSAIKTSRKLGPATSIDRFYRQCKPFTAPGHPFALQACSGPPIFHSRASGNPEGGLYATAGSVVPLAFTRIWYQILPYPVRS